MERIEWLVTCLLAINIGGVTFSISDERANKLGLFCLFTLITKLLFVSYLYV